MILFGKRVTLSPPFPHPSPCQQKRQVHQFMAPIINSIPPTSQNFIPPTLPLPLCHMVCTLGADGASSSSSISLHWQKPEQDNGSPVASYLLESASTPAGRLAPTYHKAYNGKNTNCTVSLKPLLCLHYLPALPVVGVRDALVLHELRLMPACMPGFCSDLSSALFVFFFDSDPSQRLVLESATCMCSDAQLPSVCCLFA